MSEEASTSAEKYWATLTAIQRRVPESLEVKGVRYQYLINRIRHGPSEAKLLLAHVAERKAEPVLSQMLADVQLVVGKRRVAEMMKLISKQQAKNSVKGSHGGNRPNIADGTR